MKRGDVRPCHAVHVTIASREPDRTRSLSELSARLNSLQGAGYAEVWVDHDPYPSLCVLVNGDSAWLMCLRYDGDAGFSSRNPAYDGDGDATIEYYLSNGQRDVYPAVWTYPTERALAAVEAFARDRRVPDWIDWFNDSGDGRSSPNDPWDAAS